MPRKVAHLVGFASATAFVALAVLGACVDFVPAFRLADTKIAWACAGFALLASLRLFVTGRSARAVAWRARRPVARWVLAAVVPVLLAPLLWLVFVRALPWAWTRGAGFPTRWHISVIVVPGDAAGCATAIWHPSFHAWPNALCVPTGNLEPGRPVRAELTGWRSVVGFAVATVALRPALDPAMPEKEFVYDPTIELER
jgi:hypothetical protein